MHEDYVNESHERSDENNEDAIDRIWKSPKQWANIVIVALNVVVFILVEITGSSLDTKHMIQWGASYPPLIQQGEFYRLLTCMFLHFGINHLINNMFLLFFIGDYMERILGKVRYLIIYLAGGLGASIISYLHSIKIGENVVAAGASGAIFAAVGGLIYILIRNKGQLDGLSLQRVFIMAALSLYVGFTSSGVDNYAHAGGLICGFLLGILVYRKKTGSRTVKTEP